MASTTTAANTRRGKSPAEPFYVRVSGYKGYRYTATVRAGTSTSGRPMFDPEFVAYHEGARLGLTIPRGAPDRQQHENYLPPEEAKRKAEEKAAQYNAVALAEGVEHALAFAKTDTRRIDATRNLVRHLQEVIETVSYARSKAERAASDLDEYGDEETRPVPPVPAEFAAWWPQIVALARARIGRVLGEARGDE